MPSEASVIPTWQAARDSSTCSICCSASLGAALALLGQLLDPAAAGAHDRELGGDEEAVDERRAGSGGRERRPSSDALRRAGRGRRLTAHSLVLRGQVVFGHLGASDRIAGQRVAASGMACACRRVPRAARCLRPVRRAAAGRNPRRARTRLAAARSQTAEIDSDGLTPRLVGIAEESMQKRPSWPKTSQRWSMTPSSGRVRHAAAAERVRGVDAGCLGQLQEAPEALALDDPLDRLVGAFAHPRPTARRASS